MKVEKILRTLLFIIVIPFLLQCEVKAHNQNVDNNYRGIILFPYDIISMGTPRLIEFMRMADLNLLGIHTNPILLSELRSLKVFLESEDGKLLFKECEKYGISIEYELHVLEEVLPRKLFDKHPEYFREDNDGVRQRNYNMCFTSEGAYQEIEKSITEILEWLKPTTHRYVFWTDDLVDHFCHCSSCREYSDSEQSLMFSNKLLTMIRKIDPLATVAFSTANVDKVPVKIKPLEGIFYEYAPITRDYSNPLSEEEVKCLKDHLEIFPSSTAHILEYWIDVSMFSYWDIANIVEVPWNKQQCDRDVKFYDSLGIKSITSFATWFINQNYIRRYGEKNTENVIKEYGTVLNNYIK